MDDYNSELDGELAAFTDDILNGDADLDQVSGQLADLAPVVAQLRRALASEGTEDTLVHDRVRQRLSQEWTMQTMQPLGRTGRARRRRMARPAQMALMAAALLVVLLGVVLLAGGPNDPVLEGTASGSGPDVWVSGLLIGGLVVAGAAAYWVARRSKK